MNSILINPSKVEDASKKIKELAIRYDNLISKFYTRINGINKKTCEWVGNDADEYIAYLNSFKNSYEEMSKIIKKYIEILDLINSKTKFISIKNDIK